MTETNELSLFDVGLVSIPVFLFSFCLTLAGISNLVVIGIFSL